MNVFLMIVAAVWGLSALAVIVLYLVDERAFRRRNVEQTPTSRPAATRTAPPLRQFVSSGAR